MKTAEFEAALREYQIATKKDMATVINRALRNVGFRAAEFTPKKSPEVIESELRKEQIALKFITKKLKAGAVRFSKKGRTRKKSKGVVGFKRLKDKRVTRKQIALRTRQFIARRKKRTGFLRAGWVAAVIAAGATVKDWKGGKWVVRGERTLKDSGSKLGSGGTATPDNLRAYLGNGVWGRLNGKSASRTRAVMQQALARAMSFVANDMKTYAREQMTKTAKKYSARRGGNKPIGSQIDALLRRG